ncbi:hypothetical protein RND81_13G003600 [Saponaria officinalis]|uniref:CCHC-type domain-containing protein n=1 Tax=Saponaria officinalis TaxID=3572 RepID=A0AAW1GSQ2_SAPOF
MTGHVREDCFRLKDCTYCGKTGHVKMKCYKLKGYPDKGSERGRGRSAANQYNPGSNIYRRGAHNVDVVAYESSPLSDVAAPSDNQQHPPLTDSAEVVPSTMVDGIINTVLTKVMKAIADTGPSYSYYKKAGVSRGKENVAKKLFSVANGILRRNL